MLKISAQEFLLEIEIDKEPDVYKEYLEDYFKDLSLSKKFFTDVSNYLAYEIGQPTHCYDFKSIKGSITLESCENTELFKPLTEDNEIELNSNTLVFKDNNGVINLAGIMGSKDTACKKSSKKILIECAYFKPNAIIGDATKYNLNSDASHKFERGVDPNCHDFALRRFIKIVEEHAKILKLERYTLNKPTIKKEIPIDLKLINNILGTDVDYTFFKNSLEKLGFDFKERFRYPHIDMIYFQIMILLKKLQDS